MHIQVSQAPNEKVILWSCWFSMRCIMWENFWPSSWAVVKAEGKPSSSMTEQLLFGSHMVPTSAIPSVSQVVAPQRSWWHRDKCVLLYSHWKPENQIGLGPCSNMLCVAGPWAAQQTMKGTNSKHVGVFLKYIEAEGRGRWAATDFLFVFLHRGKNIRPLQSGINPQESDCVHQVCSLSAHIHPFLIYRTVQSKLLVLFEHLMFLYW